MTNPYIKNEVLLPSLVFYADILGFSNMIVKAVEQNEDEQFLSVLKKSLNRAYTSIKKNDMKFGDISDFEIKVFTDNLVIGYPVKNIDFDQAESEFGILSNIVSEYQLNLAMDGFFIRGGISFGKVYMNENFVFGDALIKAHNLERKGGPPRVTISPELMGIIFKQIDFYSNFESSPQYNEILRDSNGEFFINYLDRAFDIFPEGGIFFEVIKKHKNQIESNLRKFETNPYTRNKYEWAGRYHNFVCNEIISSYSLYLDPDIDPDLSMACEEAQKLSDYIIPNTEGNPPSRINPSLEGNLCISP